MKLLLQLSCCFDPSLGGCFSEDFFVYSVWSPTKFGCQRFENFFLNLVDSLYHFVESFFLDFFLEFHIPFCTVLWTEESAGVWSFPCFLSYFIFGNIPYPSALFFGLLNPPGYGHFLTVFGEICFG